MEEWTTHETVYEGPIFTVRSGQARLANGRLSQRDVVLHPGGVGIVPILEGQVLLVRQYRIAVEDYLLEIPAGKVEGSEPPDYRAVRELEEETGYRAGTLRLLADYYSSAGFTDERMFLYLAAGLQPVGQQLEGEEQIEVVPLSLARVGKMLAAGAFHDAKTIIGLRELLARPELLAAG